MSKYGLFDDHPQYAQAVEECDQILLEFNQKITAWQKKFIDVGASDSAAREILIEDLHDLIVTDAIFGNLGEND